MGTIGATVPAWAAVPSAMRAAPVRRVASEGSEWLSPSGKIPTASPAASAACAASNTPAFRSTSDGSSWRRYTGIAHAERTNGPTSFSSNNGALARNRTGRSAAAVTSTGSTSEFG